MKLKTSFGIVVCLIFVLIYQQSIAGEKSEQIRAALTKSSKLIESDLVLKDLKSEADKTRVIVSLFEPTDLQLSSKPIPKSFLDGRHVRNPALRAKLREAVQALLDQIIPRLDSSHVRVTNRFSYIFGFSAEVTLEGLAQIEMLDEVVSISTDMILEAHLAQGIPLINAIEVRNIYNGAGLAIAICDTGIDTSHPMLGNGGFPIFNSKVIGGYDTGDNDTDPRPHPTLGNPHGTACAGIAAGDLNSIGDYVGGVAHNAKLYAVKISFGNGGSAYSSDMIEGWEWCITHQYDDPDNPIMIVSTSFGGQVYTGNCDSVVPAMTRAAANALDAGITLFVSSGNGGYTNGVSWPSCISHVNSVGAVYDANVGYHGYSVCTDPTTAPDQVTCYSNSASFLSIFAPSHDAYTTDISGQGGYSTGNYTYTFGGTSAACPYAAGAAAALQSAAKELEGSYLTPAEIKSFFVSTGDMITDPKAPAITKPRINLQAAVDAIGYPSNDCSSTMEGFEQGNVPPTGWTQIQTNPNETWELLTTDPYTGTFAATVFSDSGSTAQDEVLLTPRLPIGSSAMLSFYSYGSIDSCRDIFDNCDLEVWAVVDDWDGGLGDDIYIGKADDDWNGNGVWSLSSFDLTSSLPPQPVRLGFRYVGINGAQVALDDIKIEICSDGHFLMLLRQNTDGKFKLQIYDIPTAPGGDIGPPIATDNYLGTNITDIGAPRIYGALTKSSNWMDGLALLRQKPDNKLKLQIYDVPSTTGGDIDPPLASDNYLGATVEYISTGNFDSDPEDEIALLRRKPDGNYKLLIYDVPTALGVNIDPPIATDFNVGAGIISMSAANFDADKKDELVFVRLRTATKLKLEIYDAPSGYGGDTGAPIASDNYFGENIVDLAAGNFDGDPENEIAVVRQGPDGNYKLQIFDVPTARGGDTGPAVVSDNNVGEGIRAISSLSR